MKFTNGSHLAYCTNVHRGENWQETFYSLKTYTLAVCSRVSPHQPFAIGLRLSAKAAHELSQACELSKFQNWLEKENCYVFTINGFPFGNFHGIRVKENVYLPDWTSRERLEYTKQLFKILAELVPSGIEGSISTLPGSFKEFIREDEQRNEIKSNLIECANFIADLNDRSGKKLHLGLEPEPLGLFETTSETIQFFEEIWNEYPSNEPSRTCLGVNYDTCHLAIEYEEPAEAIGRFIQSRIKISKIHLSSALVVEPNPQALKQLMLFVDDIYLHQVIVRLDDGNLCRYKDLDIALNQISRPEPKTLEWRIHFHIPLHAPATLPFGNTVSHVLGIFSILKENPSLCSHLEMETYTWEVLPSYLKSDDVVDQLVKEYQWTIEHLDRVGIKPV